MSVQNGVKTVSPAIMFTIPMLGDKRSEDYPRFLNVFLGDEDHPEFDDCIHVCTRVGGDNREQGFGEEDLYDHPEYVDTFDDDFDSTCGTYVFSVPEIWKSDFELVKAGKFKEISAELKAQVCKVFPNLGGELPWE